VEPDPLGVQGGINLYRYAVQNPVMWFDPDGLCPCPGGVWDQDFGDSSFSLAFGGYIGGGRVYLTCRSRPSTKCSVHAFCIGGGPILGGGLNWNLYGVVKGAPDSSDLTGWSGWQVATSVGPVSAQAPTGGGGSIGLGLSLGAGLAAIKCNMTGLICDCKDCE
jgi:hypothetical protein